MHHSSDQVTLFSFKSCNIVGISWNYIRNFGRRRVSTVSSTVMYVWMNFIDCILLCMLVFTYFMPVNTTSVKGHKIINCMDEV
jgi:hypothetical protein